MLVTKQQTFLCETLDLLGGARLDQLAALIRPVFCLEQPDIAPRVVDTALRQLHHRNVEIIRDGDLAYYPGKKPDPLFLDAVDVMLELTEANPVSFFRDSPPILLRFSAQEEKVRLFCVMAQGADLYGAKIYDTERVILLFDGRSQAQALPVSNKQFLAVRQSDRRHRFYALTD